MVDSTDPLLGQSIGNYRIVRLIGEGGMGQVYLGLQPSIGSRVAIKVLSQTASKDSNLVERFFTEARLVNKIRHEGIVNVLDMAHLPDGRPMIIMEHLEGETLSRAIQHGSLPLGTVANIAAETLDALQAAHDTGVVHRDLKPDNIFLSPQGRVKVLDFGVAKLMPSFEATVAASTQAGDLLGTPAYMAPEQINQAAITPAVDLFALGAILYEMVTGGRPFEAGSMFELLRKILEDEPVPPTERRSDLGPEFQTLILQCLSKDPAERGGSAKKVAERLRQISSAMGASAFLVIEGSDTIPSAATMDSSGLEATMDSSGLEATMDSAGLLGSTMDSAQLGPTMDSGGPRRLLVAALLLLTLAAGGTGAILVIGSNAKSEDPQTLLATTSPDAGAPIRTVIAMVVDAAVAGSPSDADPKPAAPKPKPAAPKPKPIPKDAPKPAPASQVDASVPKPRPGVIFIETGDSSKTIRLKPNFNTAAFDGTWFLPQARKLAKKIYSDAVLTEFVVPAVFPTGKSNLGLGSLEATYEFRSPSRSKRTLPIGIEEDIPCMVYVEVSKNSIEAWPATREVCKDKRRPTPQCSIKEVWAKAIKMGAPSSGHVAKISYLWDGWFFDIHGVFTKSIPDHCP